MNQNEGKLNKIRVADTLKWGKNKTINDVWNQENLLSTNKSIGKDEILAYNQSADYNHI